jgi:hypothetical protein
MPAKPVIGPWKFDKHPWLKGIMDSPSRMVVGRKAAQMGYSEAAINRIFYMMDIRKVSCMYVLPNIKPDASDFSASRFDPALDASPHLREIFTDTKNIGLKRAGGASLYIRGSRSRSGLKSVPAGFIVVDELEEMEQSNIPLVFERASGQNEEDVAYFLLSTPILAKMGIDKWYSTTNQKIFTFKCPHCSRWSELLYPDSLVVCGNDEQDPDCDKSHLICHQCKHTLNHADKSSWLSLANTQWTPTIEGVDTDGFTISQLYSFMVSPGTLARKVHRAKIYPEDEQELYNSKLGLPHEVKGARVTDEDIKAVEGSFVLGTARRGGIVTLGIDVGTDLHYELTEYMIPNAHAEDINAASSAKVLMAGTVKNFEDFDPILNKYNVNYTVVDANPERREATKFARRNPGLVSLCFYGNSSTGRSIRADDENHTITVDRVTWMDTALRRFNRVPRRIVLPQDIPLMYKDQIKAPVRIYGRDAHGNPVGDYVHSQAEPDHFAHARTYSEIALACALSAMGVMENIK